MLCVGQQACKDATILCPADHACEILCEGQQACQQTMITCGGGSCSLTCDGDDQACDNLELQCGTADGHVACPTPQSNPLMLLPAKGSSCGCTAAPRCGA